MIKGSTVIMNDTYIETLSRHRDNYKERMDNESLPSAKKALEEKYTYFARKVDEALDFRDTVEEIINIDIPRITVVKTISGMALPLSNIQIL